MRSVLHLQAIATLTKQSSQATLHLVNNASHKVTQAVHHIKEHIGSNFASATGFVTFKTRRAMVSAAQVPVLSQQYPKVSNELIVCVDFRCCALFTKRTD